MTTESTKLTIDDALHIMGWSVYRLAKKAGLHYATVARAMTPNGVYKTNETSASAIATALGVKVDDITWPNGTSINGRPAASGGSMSGPPHHDALCPVHSIVLPASKVCDMCE